MGRHLLRTRLLAASVLTAAACAALPLPASAQTIVYDSSGQPQQQSGYYDPNAQYAQPQVQGNLVGRTAFYGRLGVGAGYGMHRTTIDRTDPVALRTGPSLHFDGSFGLRFAMVHALTVDVDLDRGFAPTAEGDALDNGTAFTGSFGGGYTNFLNGTGTFISAGMGVAMVRLNFNQPPPDGRATENTATGFSVHARVGHDWNLGARARLGVVGTVRYYRMVDNYDLDWRGAGLTAAASFSWY